MLQQFMLQKGKVTADFKYDLAIIIHFTQKLPSKLHPVKTLRTNPMMSLAWTGNLNVYKHGGSYAEENRNSTYRNMIGIKAPKQTDKAWYLQSRNASLHQLLGLAVQASDVSTVSVQLPLEITVSLQQCLCTWFVFTVVC
jgi:hypothetical protein